MKKSSFAAGFTLIELIVSLAVFSIVTSVVLYNYSNFNTNVLITNYAYDVALSIRQAQVYGVSVRERQVVNPLTGKIDPNANSGIFTSSYGTHFDAATPSSLIFFADETGNGHVTNRYDKGAAPSYLDNESLETRSLPGSYVFSKFCAILKNGTQQCNVKGGIQDISFLDISFTRPEPDAIIKTDHNIDHTTDDYKGATICVQSPLGKKRQILIELTGQISVSSDASDAACN